MSKKRMKAPGPTIKSHSTTFSKKSQFPFTDLKGNVSKNEPLEILKNFLNSIRQEMLQENLLLRKEIQEKLSTFKTKREIERSKNVSSEDISKSNRTLNGTLPFSVEMQRLSHIEIFFVSFIIFLVIFLVGFQVYVCILKYYSNRTPQQPYQLINNRSVLSYLSFNQKPQKDNVSKDEDIITMRLNRDCHNLKRAIDRNVCNVQFFDQETLYQKYNTEKHSKKIKRILFHER
ncbi:hypothetical protein AVEN_246454-1 [Araneus ventricosus]|uniref:Uncharacterized protein n=1 Tax=Araneus ventricosus TaxID=182803 RepID=A0A4Y2EL15_ARAVE|nr:hypothetical protein AVEN_246454-1 [Araneus ventricosus]